MADWGRYVLRATRRHAAIVLSLVVLGCAALVGYYAWKTPVYRVETTILAQRQQALPTLVRSTTPDDAPTRLAGELIHRRENLLELIEKAKLLPAASRAAPAAPSTWPRSWLQAVGIVPDDEGNPTEAMVKLLDKKLKVATSEGTISISVDWPDARQAYLIVTDSLQNFLEARQLQEITAIDDAIALLQGRLVVLRDQVDRAVEEAKRGGSREAPAPRQASAPPGTAEEIARVRSALTAKERAVADVEEFRRKRLADLQAQLDHQRNTYSEQHPAILALKSDIAALSEDSAQAKVLREEERRLREEYAELTRNRGTVGVVETRPAPDAGSLVERDERVREARNQYAQMVERLHAAQLELDAARAAFKYRYQVVWPAQMPTKPVSPNPAKVFGLGIPLVLLLAIALAVFLDWRTGVILESWQVERELGLTVLGDFRR